MENNPQTFDTTPRTRLVYGVGTVERVAGIAGAWNAKRVLLVTDKHIVAAGHAPRAQQSFETAGTTVAVYDEVHENPTTDDVDACLAFAADFQPDTIVGLGGGSALDTAKGCNLLFTNAGRMSDYRGYGKAVKPTLPLIAIPTTAGTGSECQSYAIIAEPDSHMKMACGDPKLAARVAILDPELTLTQPKMVTSHTGVDALTHAVETAVTTRRNPFSLMHSRESLRLITQNFECVINHPTELEARGRMSLAAAYAGIAIENSMLGAAHAAANPLTAHFGIVHGEAVGLMLPAVMRFNAEDPDTLRLYRSLAVGARLVGPATEDEEAFRHLLHFVTRLLNHAIVPPSLEKAGVSSNAIPMMAAEAADQWTGRFNPRKAQVADFIALYETVYSTSRPHSVLA